MFSSYAQAKNTVIVGDINFNIERPHALNAFNSSMDDVGGILKRFKPVGAQIKNLKVTGNILQFRVVKNIFMAVNIKAIAEVEKENSFCSSDSLASFKVLMDLRESDSIVSSNLESLNIDICVKEPAVDQLSVSGRGVIYKAPTYTNGTGGQLLSGMTEQVPGIIEAIRAHVLAIP